MAFALRPLFSPGGLAQATQGRLLDLGAFRQACAAGRLVPVRAYLQSGGDPNARLEVATAALEGEVKRLRSAATARGVGGGGGGGGGGDAAAAGAAAMEEVE